MNFIGLDAGSVSVKLVVLDELGRKLYGHYERHKGHPVSFALKLIRGVPPHIAPAPHSSSLSVTGSAGRLIASILGIKPVNEIVAQALSTHLLFPQVKTIIEMGGEDSKLIVLGDDGRAIKDFSMNSVCAAGTGSFLDQQAERLRLTIQEFSALALKSKKPPRIAGRCSVFAKSDMIHLQQIATPVDDIVAGLCFAVARNFKGAISRGRKVVQPVCFQGGVAANQGMVRAFREIFGIEDLLVPDDHALMVAIGAALKNLREGAVQNCDISLLDEFLTSYRPLEDGYPPLTDLPSVVIHQSNHIFTSNPPLPPFNKGGMGGLLDSKEEKRVTHSDRIKACLGIDIGSISTNLAVVDEEGRLLSKRYLMTAGRPIEAVCRGLSEIGDELGHHVEIMGVGTTGSGRYMIADYVGADIVKNEITAQATAAAFIDKDVDTIFEIGGQDSKYVSLKDGVIVDFEMNKACAAGTGSFLEEQAEKLDISIKGEFAQKALAARNPCRLGERCTVFMENSLMANLQKGADKKDLLAGLAYSIVQNYINRVVAGKHIGENIFFQGGVAFNRSVVSAFENYLQKKITVPPHHDVTGAIGMALIAMQHMQSRATQSTFKGFELSKRSCEISSFTCTGCPNVCEINRVKIAGEEGFLFYGGRCEKYDVRRKRHSSLPDLFAFREELLWREHEHRKESARERVRDARPRIGIPYTFFFHDYLPYWTALLWELGFEVEVSDKTNRQILNAGLERVLSEACYPVKVAHGHLAHLTDLNVDAVFLPSFVNLSMPEDEYERGMACPHTQTIPYISNIVFRGLKLITPVINLRRGRPFLLNELRQAFRPFGIKKHRISRALEAAEKAQAAFTQAIKEKGSEILSNFRETAVVIIGRAYNSFDGGVNLEIPKKLSDLGVLSIPFDFLPIDQHSLYSEWPNMYWRSGQSILKAARFVRDSRNLYPIYIGNFLCGPDSFILKYFRQEMGTKPFLHIEIDEHSADAGAITRCEAFMDSIQNRINGHPGHAQNREKTILPRHRSPITNHAERTIFIPRMSVHALAVAAAFEHCGVGAEVLPESDKTAIDVGKKFVSGKECYPCLVTTGDMVKKATHPDFKPDKSAFFMPSGTGPCRFGQYNVFHKSVLEDIGLQNVPIFSPTQDTTFYADLGLVGREFSLQSWKGIIAYELLTKSLHETRPYERAKGTADALYEEYVRNLYQVLRGTNGNTIEGVLGGISNDFGHLPVEGQKRPLIGIIGEIFVRSHQFSNENLVRKIEALGGEVWLAPVEEWVYYINQVGLRKALLKKDKSAIINFLLKRFFQKRIEHKYGRFFRNFLKTLHEPDTKEILRKASPYVHSSFEGETILSVGKCIDLIERGASGIVNAMPFGCMPGTIVTAILRGITRDYGIPCISIPYDGTESATIEIQLEAFMDQAREYRRQRAADSR
jgi:predicted CoA-substrate-specific enzyme activase